MKFSTLPDDLEIELKDESAVQIYRYQINRDFYKNKINLTRNTISFLRQGTKEVIGNDKNVKIGKGKFVVMKAGRCLMTEHISTEFNFYKSILLFFSNDIASKLLEQKKVNQASKANNAFYAFDYDDYIHHFVESLEKLMKMDAKIQSQLLPRKFEEIILYLIEKEGISFLNDIVQNPNTPQNRLISVVEQNRLNKLNLQELAFLTNMSVSTFKREFQKCYHQSPIKWFQKQRLENAAYLLRIHKKRPIEILEETGYESLTNFVQAFKKEYGVTPKQYQNQV